MGFFTPFLPMAKAVIASVVSAGAIYVGMQVGIPVPAEATDWVTQAAMAVLGGLITGGVTYAVPNKKKRA